MRPQVYEYEEPTAGAAEVEADKEAGDALEVSYTGCPVSCMEHAVCCA